MPDSNKTQNSSWFATEYCYETNPEQLNISFQAISALNANSECSLLAAYSWAYGSGRLTCFIGQQPLALFLHSSRELAELLQCSKYDSTLNIVQVLLLCYY